MTRKIFLGTYDGTIDDKGRVRIPAKYKTMLEDEFAISYSTEECLEIYPMDTLYKLSDEVNSLDKFSRASNQLSRTLFPHMTDGTFDSAGRILIPLKFRSHVGLQKALAIVGVNDHFEIWDADKWNSMNYDSMEFRSEVQKQVTEERNGGKA